ncbi:MAG: hypothetical protein ACOYM0_01435 [Bacteroidales bacterium]
MIEEETIQLYDAIKQMRMLSHEDKTFSFMHATYNRDTDTTNGFRHVERAHLRPAAKGEDLANSDYKLFYFDEILNEPRNCWQMLIMQFNGQRVVLN